LESAVTLTKGLRWDIQALGQRLSKAAAAEESSKKSKTQTKTKAAHIEELRAIIQDIKKLLIRIEDAVPLINLAITTSGANLSTTLPQTVSPSRLLQASTFLTAGDTQYSIDPSRSVQIGPTFTLSIYMLFGGYSNRTRNKSAKELSWKEVIHKARVKLMRVPLNSVYAEQYRTNGANGVRPSIERSMSQSLSIHGEGSASEYAYQLSIIEDLDDHRVHTFDDGDPRPGPYDDVEIAGIREVLPIHQISKIFYADTGKILSIGSEGEANAPVLLLKRDVNAAPPRRMMESTERDSVWGDMEDEPAYGHDSENAEGPHETDEDDTAASVNSTSVTDYNHSETDGTDDYESATEGKEEDYDDSFDPSSQLLHESSFVSSSLSTPLKKPEPSAPQPSMPPQWRFPPDLDPEWIAFEVYNDTIDDSDDEADGDELDNSPTRCTSRRSSGVSAGPPAHDETADDLAREVSALDLNTSFSSTSASTAPYIPRPSPLSFPPSMRTSLSLLEMLIRLTALQQFQQAAHLSIPDELLTFFLEESSTTGGNGEERRRLRERARGKVGFDPYVESPVVGRHGGESRSGTPRGGTPTGGSWRRDDGVYGDRERYVDGYHSERDYSREPSAGGTPSYEEWQRSRERSPYVSRRSESRQRSPTSPYITRKTPVMPLYRVQNEGRKHKSSPLAKDTSGTDSTLGTSPTTPVKKNVSRQGTPVQSPLKKEYTPAKIPVTEGVNVKIEDSDD
jgi:hypothetical protein